MLNPDPQDIQPQFEDQGADQQQPQAMEFIQAVIARDNIAGEIEESTLDKMSQQLHQDYETDKESMGPWLEASEAGLKYAQLVKEDKTYPHDKAANIKYPLILDAALQYNARTFSEIVPSGNPVMVKVNGEDDGTKSARAKRTGDYGSYQLRNDIPNWEPDMDRLTLIQPIVGMMFKKVWFNPAKNTTTSKLCQPGKVIVNHNISHITDAPAITEELEFQPHEIETRIRGELWEDVRDKIGWHETDGVYGAVEASKPEEFLEQQMRFDLDDDGYPEPYVVTIHKESKTIVRIVANFEMEDVMLSPQGEIMTIQPSMHFVPYPFMPAFDGGFHGSGLGMLLGDTSETINTTLNMLVDAGHYQSMPTGWIAGQDLRIKPGTIRMKPGDWWTLNASGADIRSGMQQMTMPAPSPVLFQMLGLLIDMGKEIAASKAIAPEQAAQMTATTTMALVQQGERVYNATFKRLYLAAGTEYKLMFKLNRAVDPEKYNAFFDDEEKYDPAADFDLRGMDVLPVADPKAVTDIQKAAKAEFLMGLSNEGKIDAAAATMRVLEAMAIEDIDELMPQATPQSQMIEEMRLMSAKLALRMQAAELDKTIAETIRAIADAESAEEGDQLGEYMNVLKAMKMEIDNEQARFGPMAGAPGNGGIAGPNATLPSGA